MMENTMKYKYLIKHRFTGAVVAESEVKYTLKEYAQWHAETKLAKDYNDGNHEIILVSSEGLELRDFKVRYSSTGTPLIDDEVLRKSQGIHASPNSNTPPRVVEENSFFGNVGGFLILAVFVGIFGWFIYEFSETIGTIIIVILVIIGILTIANVTRKR
ncbi:MAG: hypothetical protein ACO1NS_11180 [Daejeonella sp.]